ncbi:MAG TPA: tripartite tricarboxylate transporter substrate binding protein [Pseudonocardia sp.]|uniref:Bug family tripartite tricarboxylate transporter substrate binding protein n=1 Tax=Pseudonocardia sp. TaxID=60912 RepID=UPI002B4ACF0C|nr:tripartite tricarboxylate transporter substrate binding protein [Pseudonocardia sp.]HLU54659.1 tripartite tricarboxylate transporter substrate binding protein [Pseudonocardia sp.]
MAPARYTRRTALAGAGAALVLALAACGGNLGSSGAGGEQAAESFPTGPINLAVGQDPGGSTDLIARALADRVSDDLGVPVPVVNTPGANGALAAKELAGKAPDGQNLMVFNASLAAITPLAVPADQAVDIADFEVVTGISQDDFILVANPATGFRTVQDIVNAGRPITYGTTGVGTGSQLSQALLFAQAGIEANAVPFDGASPAMTALLGGQVDVAGVQLGDAKTHLESVNPIVVFSEERSQYFPDVPTAVEAGYDATVSQYRAVVAPKGTPAPVLDRLRQAFTVAFQAQEYQDFNAERLLAPYEVDGATVISEWTAARDRYRALIDQYGIAFGDQG